MKQDPAVSCEALRVGVHVFATWWEQFLTNSQFTQPGEDPLFLMGTKVWSSLGEILMVSQGISLGPTCIEIRLIFGPGMHW